jgi:hypothetical protein
VQAKAGATAEAMAAEERRFRANAEETRKTAKAAQDTGIGKALLGSAAQIAIGIIAAKYGAGAGLALQGATTMAGALFPSETPTQAAANT